VQIRNPDLTQPRASLSLAWRVRHRHITHINL
jgi:hypothetical protein